MLVLGRHENERICLSYPGGEIRLTVVQIRGDKVRLGFDAPDEVVVDREEIFRLKLAQRAHAKTRCWKCGGYNLAPGETHPSCIDCGAECDREWGAA